MQPESKNKYLKNSIIMFVASTLALAILILVWEGVATDYVVALVCVYGFGYSAQLLRQHLRKEVRYFSEEEVRKTKNRLIRSSVMSWLGSLIVLEIIMYFQDYPTIALLAFPVVSILLLGPILFFTIRKAKVLGLES